MGLLGVPSRPQMLQGRPRRLNSALIRACRPLRPRALVLPFFARACSGQRASGPGLPQSMQGLSAGTSTPQGQGQGTRLAYAGPQLRGGGHRVPVPDLTLYDEQIPKVVQHPARGLPGQGVGRYPHPRHPVPGHPGVQGACRHLQARARLARAHRGERSWNTHPSFVFLHMCRCVCNPRGGAWGVGGSVYPPPPTGGAAVAESPRPVRPGWPVTPPAPCASQQRPDHHRGGTTPAPVAANRVMLRAPVPRRCGNRSRTG